MKILDNHLGLPPQQFKYNGQNHTPKTFARDFLVNIDFETDLIRSEIENSQLAELKLPHKDLVEYVLTSGEEHVLLGTAADPASLPGFIVLGRVREGNGVTIDGTAAKLRNSGFQHRWN